MFRLSVASISLLVVSAAFADPVEILRTGIWHGDEVHVEPGRDWWGIFPEGEGFTLQPAPVAMTLAEDPVIDAPGGRTGKGISVPQEAAPVLLVRGLKKPVQGEIEMAMLDTPTWYATQSIAPEINAFLFPGQVIELKMRADAVRLVAMGTVEEEPEFHQAILRNYEIRLYRGSREAAVSQSLDTISRMRDLGRPHLVWAGDLDRDGKIDLLYNLSDHYNVSRLTLFLSSAAKEGEFVGKVAEWVTTGC